MKQSDSYEGESDSKMLCSSHSSSYVRANSVGGANQMDQQQEQHIAQQMLDEMEHSYTECATCGKLVAGNLPMMDVLLLVAGAAQPIIPSQPPLIGLVPKLCVEDIVCLECGKAFEVAVQAWAESQDALMMARGGEAMPAMFAPAPTFHSLHYKTIVETCNQADDGGDFAYCWWLTDDQIKGLCAAIHQWRNSRVVVPHTELGKALEAAADVPFKPLEEGDR